MFADKQLAGADTALLEQGMAISPDLLETTCKNTIETILLCLKNATKGTIYRIGPMPRLQAVRITSGIRDEETGQIKWGLPGASDYNPPGKIWEEYKDLSGRPLEAMGWCVERQKSWTADNPYENIRSVRKQLYGEIEDSHHMEPVLVKKMDLYRGQLERLKHPVDQLGNPIWQDTEYVVVAVIKIHFKPHSIKRRDDSTKIIKKLSQTLGTEMLSLHLRENLLQAQKELAQERLLGCNVVAHELRNTLTKLGFVFAAINAEISFLREQWEIELRSAFPELEDKRDILERLNHLIRLRIRALDGSEELVRLAKELLEEEEKLPTLYMLPHQEEQWIRDKVQPRWERLLSESEAWKLDEQEIRDLLRRLKKAIWIGTDADLVRKMVHVPEEFKDKWPQLIYKRFSAKQLHLLDEILRLLEHPQFNLLHKQHTQRVFTSLKALAEIIPEVERRTNKIIAYLRSGILQD